MNIHTIHQKHADRAFSTVEAVIGMTLMLMIVIAIYSGITFGLNNVRMARENTRATQILIEKTEQLRLFNWDQLTSTSNSFLPTNKFLISYYATNIGVTYTGLVSLKPLAIPGTRYTNDMREITVSLSWTTGEIPRRRSLTTYVSRYGIQNYIY